MPTPDARFERELNIFRTETEQATQFYFALLAMNGCVLSVGFWANPIISNAVIGLKKPAAEPVS